MLHLELDKIHEYTRPVSQAGSLMAMDSFYKARQVLNEGYSNVAVSISGGKDSDIMLDIITKLLIDKSEVRYIWFDTGLEYAATKRHLDDLEQKYGITIKPIPLSCKEYGIPFLSKMVSEQIERLQKYGFQWEDEDYDTLAERYPKCKSAISWWCNHRDTKEHGFSMFNKSLKDFLLANPPEFKISKQCCNYAKENIDMSEFERFGFKKCRGEYYLCVSRGCQMIYDINPWSDDDPRIHARAKTSARLLILPMS